MAEGRQSIDWLLDSKTPSIRYRTMTDLLGLPEEEPRVIEAKKEIMRSGPVPAILAGQAEKGNWKGERGYYTPKYISTHWSMLLLAELDCDGSDAGYERGAAFMLEAPAAELERHLDSHLNDLTCFWGNVLRYTTRARNTDPVRQEQVVRLISEDLLNGPCRCIHNSGALCAWGAVRALWGLASIPKAKRTPETEAAIRAAGQFLLEAYSLTEANYPVWERGKVSLLWSKLNFPLFYQADILLTLRTLDELELLGLPGAQKALDWLLEKRRPDGTWAGTSPFRQRTWRELGGREETDRFVTLQALRILVHAGRIASLT